MVALMNPRNAIGQQQFNCRCSYRPRPSIGRKLLRLPGVLFWLVVISLLTVAGQWDVLHRLGGRR